MPNDYDFVKSGFLTQDLIRTVNLSFQPYMPFSQTYAMSLQDKGGGLSGQTQDAGYWRMGPPKAEDNRDNGSIDSTYPFSLRRELYGGNPGNATGKLSNVAKNTDRIKAISGVVPPTGDKVAPLAMELAKLLNVSYAFDGQSFVDQNFTPQQSRDAHELEVGMFSQQLDDALGSRQSGRVEEGPLRDVDDLLFTKKTVKNFDIPLKNYRSLNSYIEHLYGEDYNSSVDFLEVSHGAREKAFFNISTTDNTAENLKKLVKHINSKITQYNRQIMAGIGPHLKEMRLAGIATSPSEDMMKLATPYLYAELGRETGKPNQDRNSADAMIRQIMGRFALNEFRPYYFEGQLSNDSFAIITLTPELHNDVPQIAQVDSTTVKIETDAATLKQGLYAFEVEIRNSDAKKVLQASKRAMIAASAMAIGTESTLESVGRYSRATVGMNAVGGLEVTVRADGESSIHKMSLDINNKLREDIEAYYSTGKMKGQFKIWYEKMIQASNSLTKKWYENSSKVVGQRGKPLSEEWRAMSSWTKGDDFKKKYIGVWSSKNEQTWKDGIGKNFSISPFLESRRQFSGGLASSEFTLVDER